jgi:hypothetical protein
MSMSTGDDDFELELEVEAELSMAESSRAEEVVGEPVSEWLFDPADEQQYEIGLRSLLGAVEEVQRGSRIDSAPVEPHPSAAEARYL